MRLGVSAALVAGSIVPGDVSVDDGRVTGVGLLPAGVSGLAAPGFVDVQVNGFAGVDFVAADADGYARAGAALAGTGVVAYQPTFISCPVDTCVAAITTLRHSMARQPGPRVLPAHLEGPFLSTGSARSPQPRVHAAWRHRPGRRPVRSRAGGLRHGGAGDRVRPGAGRTPRCSEVSSSRSATATPQAISPSPPTTSALAR